MKKDFLHNKQDGFKLPDNYFEKFENNLLNAIDRKSDLQLPKQTGFKVPNDYFEDAELNILAAIAKENKTKNNFFSKYKYAISIAATIIMGVLITITFYKPNSKSIPTFDSLAASEIENYFEEGYIPVNSYEIGEVFSDEISDISITSNIDDDTIIEYLSVYSIANEQY